MSPKLTRRGFLKAGALAAATTVVSGCTVNLQQVEYLQSYVRPPEDTLPGENVWYASTCRQCPAGCGIVARVSNGRPRKIEGNPLHPLNRGKLCARGQASLQELYDPDRLQNAVKQINGRGSAQFDPIYWEEALQTLGAAISEADPGRVAFLGGNVSSHLGWVATRFLEALGAAPPISYTLGDQIEGNAPLTEASQVLFGVPQLPIYDIGLSDVVFSFGANLLETWLSPVSYSRAYSQMRRGDLGKRGYLVQFETRYSSTAVSADEWICVKPGTEGLVALALGRIIAERSPARGAADSLYERVSVPEMSEISGVPVEELERLARIFSDVARPVAVAGGALGAYENTISATKAVQTLNVMMERLGKPGGVFLPPVIDADAFPSISPSTFNETYKLIENMKAGLVQILLIHGANPVFDMPQATEFVKALSNVSLVVSFNSAVDETAEWSDMILPDHTNLEGWGYQVAPHADRRIVSGQQPVMRPLYDTRATVDVLFALAQDLGGKVGEVLPWRNEVEFLKEVTAVQPLRTLWTIWRQRGGWWAEEAEWTAPLPEAVFKEPLIPAPPTFQGDQVEYPLYHSPYLSMGVYDGRGANKSWLQELPDPMTTVTWQTWVEMNSETARGMGVEDGDVVRVISPGSEVEALIYVYPGIGEGVVAMPLGRGHQQYGRYARGRGSNPANLIVPVKEGEIVEFASGATRVRVEPTGRRSSLARLEDPEGVEYVRGHEE